MGVLNGPVYEEKDESIIYDGKHPVDAKNVQLTVAVEAKTVLPKGQIIDYGEHGYKVHAAGGTPVGILAEKTVLAEDDTDVVVPIYVSGTFKRSKVSPDLNEAGVEALRSKGIYLK